MKCCVRQIITIICVTYVQKNFFQIWNLNNVSCQNDDDDDDDDGDVCFE